MSAAVIVQARMTSTRLAGKVMEDLGGRTVLWHVLTRCAAIPSIDTVCCAVPEGARHDPIATEAEAAGAVVVRGSENDVLDRYHTAAEALGAARLMRVTSDCPLIDPEVCGTVLAALDQGADGPVDYAANNFTHRFPHGLDCEAFTAAALHRAWTAATEPFDREHVTPWLRRAPDVRRAAIDGPDGSLGAIRWTLDHPEDLAFFRALWPLLPDGIPDWRQVLDVVAANPAIAALNAGRRDR